MATPAFFAFFVSFIVKLFFILTMSYPFVNYIIVMDIIISGYSIKNSSFSFFLFKRLETQLLTYQRRNLWKCSFRYRGLLIADETGHTTRPGIFASGDVVNGARSRIAFHFKIFGQQKQQIHDLSSWICCFFLCDLLFLLCDLPFSFCTSHLLFSFIGFLCHQFFCRKFTQIFHQ